MAKNYNAGDEPIPGSGYRLVEFLGRGGFGEVWKAIGPGGVEVALKIIHLGGVAGRKEFRALQLVKRIHHPNAVPIVAYWLITADGSVLEDDLDELSEQTGLGGTGSAKGIQATAIAPPDLGKPQAAELVIAMGLGDISLFDRLAQCHAQGLEGIAEEELLGYLESAAKAIDYLNSPIHVLGDGSAESSGGSKPVAIQHCDIKPQNILIVGNATQVCDFGLARMMGTERATTTAATIAYAAPECLVEGNPSDTTDQYSLAVSYYELRTGKLPYDNEAPGAVMDAKLNETLNFGAVSPDQQAVLHRATSRDPTARFASSAAMISALRCTAGGGLSQTTVFSGEVPETKSTRGVSRFFTFAALLAIVGAGVWFFVLREPSNVASPGAGAANGNNRNKHEADNTPVTSTDNSPKTASDPQRPSAQELFSQGHKSLADKDYPAAITQLEKAIVISHDAELSKKLRAAAAEAYLARGLDRLNRCEDELIDADDLADTSPAAMKQWRAAIDDFTKAAQYAPQDPRVFSRRGQVYYLLEDWEHAADELRQAVVIEPHSGDFTRLGQVYEELGNLTLAGAAYLGAVKTDSKNTLAYHFLGRVHGEQTHYEKAIEFLSIAIDRYSENNDTDNLLDALPLRASSLLEEGRYAETMADITRIVELDPDQRAYWAEICDEAAAALAEREETQKAVKWAEKAVQIADDDETKASYQKRLDAFRKKLSGEH